jgi:hypothetical protein
LTAAVKPTYTQAMLEEILGKRIIDATVVYAGVEAESKLETYEKLGLTARVPAAERADLEQRLAAYRAIQA